MQSALRAVSDMRSAVRKWALAQNRSASDALKLSKYADSILRKIHLLDHHSMTFASADWDSLSELANGLNLDSSSRVPRPLPLLNASCRGYHIYADSFDVAELVIHAAFDAVVGGCVNSCDTLGRLMNLVYLLGERPERANLPRIAQRVPPGSPLGSILLRSPGVDWMSPLRELRGECQHGMLTEVLYRGVGGSSEYTVGTQWHFSGLSSPSAAAYVQEAKEKTFELLRRAAGAIAADPSRAISP